MVFWLATDGSDAKAGWEGKNRHQVKGLLGAASGWAENQEIVVFTEAGVELGIKEVFPLVIPITPKMTPHQRIGRREGAEGGWREPLNPKSIPNGRRN